MKKKIEKSTESSSPIVSGTFQLAEDTRTDNLKTVEEKQETLDEDSLYYARQFMED